MRSRPLLRQRWREPVDTCGTRCHCVPVPSATGYQRHRV